MPNATSRYNAALRELQGRPARPDVRPIVGAVAIVAFGGALLLMPRPAAAVAPGAMVAALRSVPRVELVVTESDVVMTHLFREGDKLRYGDPEAYWRGFDGERTWSVSFLDRLATVRKGRVDATLGPTPSVDAVLKPYLDAGATTKVLDPGHVRLTRADASIEVWFDPATNLPSRIVRAAAGHPTVTAAYHYPASFPRGTFAFRPPAKMRVLDLDRKTAR